MLSHGIRLSFSIFGPQTVRMRSLTDPDRLRVSCSGRDQAGQGRAGPSVGTQVAAAAPLPQPPFASYCAGNRRRRTWNRELGLAAAAQAALAVLAAARLPRWLWQLRAPGSSPSRARPRGSALPAPPSPPLPKLRSTRKVGLSPGPTHKDQPGVGRTSSPSHSLCASRLGVRSCGRESLSRECWLYQPPTGIRIVSSAKKSLP